MTTFCEATGRRPAFGRAVSHSHRRTPRRFDPKRLTVSTRGITTIDAQGIEAVRARVRRERSAHGGRL